MSKHITDNDMLLESVLMLCHRATRVMRAEGNRIAIDDTIEVDGEEWHVTAGSDPGNKCCAVVGHTHGKIKQDDDDDDDANPMETMLRQLGFVPASELQDNKEFQFIVPVAWLDRMGE